jgi:hypothetical protein
MRATLVALLVSIAMPMAAQNPPRWSLAPELRIGGSNATAPEYEFTTVRGIAIGPNGAIYVTQGQEQEIRVYDAQGKYVRTVGRKGGGPGEFTGLGSIGFVGDTLYTTDFQLRRITLFNADGSLITTIGAEPIQPVRTDSVVFRPSPVALLLDGSVLGSASYASSLAASGQIKAVPVFRLTRTGQVLETIALVPLGSNQGALQSGTTAMYFVQPISDAPLSVFAASAGRIFVVTRAAQAGTNSFRVTAIRSNGDSLWSRSYPYRPLPLGSARADSIRDATAKTFSGGGAGFTPDQVRKAVFIPDHQVTITRGLAAADGSLWLRREQFSNPLTWTVIAPDGNLTATLALPPNVRPLTVIGDLVWGVELDDVDVPQIVRYRIRK